MLDTALRMGSPIDYLHSNQAVMCDSQCLYEV